ncbi:ribonuclease H-like domain-containing protein [Tanacetum coccineum]|uniref:Ribonuclease H-like domain-containing protein n=1 Tax=Tanacetum coccineum TaxID=301880 RepID=A0ABQ5DQ35_9ASTR
MSVSDKTGLGYGTQLNEMSNNSETDSEISLSVFDVRTSDEESIPANDRFSKADGYLAVPSPITGNFLTPRADISFAGKTNEANIQKPKIVYESVNRDKVIIEDWNSDDEDDVSEVQTVNPVKTNDKIGQTSKKARIGFKAVDHSWIMKGNPEILLQDHAVVDSGCSSHMTGNKAYLSDYEDYNGGFVAFGSDPKGGKITSKGKIKTANLDFDDLRDESQVCTFRAPRKDDVYSLDLKNIVPSGGITCLYANATADESKLWHRRLGHVNFKNINKLVKGHLVRGLPSKVFVNDHTCVAYKRTKFKNHAMNEFCAKKGIKMEFSVARTPQQNGVAERKNRTLIEAARTMLGDSLLPIPFWAEAVNTACYVLNRALVTKPQTKTPYELLIVLEKSGYVLCSTDKGIPLEDVAPARKPHKWGINLLKSLLKSFDVLDSEDVVREGQHQMKRYEQVLHDELEEDDCSRRYSPFELEAFSDSDYRGASLDRKSTTGGCQFLGRRLIYLQLQDAVIVGLILLQRDCYEKELIELLRFTQTLLFCQDLLHQRNLDVTDLIFGG